MRLNIVKTHGSASLIINLMSRAKGGVKRAKHRRNILQKTKGFEAGRKNLIKLAKTAAMKAGAHAYRDRRVKKRTFRQLWEVRINAAVRELGTNYSKFIGALKNKQVKLDRKILALIAKDHPRMFAKIVEAVK